MSVPDGSDIRASKRTELIHDIAEEVLTALKAYLETNLNARDAAILERSKIEMTKIVTKEPNGNRQAGPLDIVDKVGTMISKAVGGEPQDLATRVLSDMLERSKRRDEMIDQAIMGLVIDRAAKHIEASH